MSSEDDGQRGSPPDGSLLLAAVASCDHYSAHLCCNTLLSTFTLHHIGPIFLSSLLFVHWERHRLWLGSVLASLGLAGEASGSASVHTRQAWRKLRVFFCRMFWKKGGILLHGVLQIPDA